jgi:hypothetical protein
VSLARFLGRPRFHREKLFFALQVRVHLMVLADRAGALFDLRHDARNDDRKPSRLALFDDARRAELAARDVMSMIRSARLEESR